MSGKPGHGGKPGRSGRPLLFPKGARRHFIGAQVSEEMAIQYRRLGGSKWLREKLAASLPPKEKA